MRVVRVIRRTLGVTLMTDDLYQSELEDMGMLAIDSPSNASHDEADEILVRLIRKLCTRRPGQETVEAILDLYESMEKGYS